MGLITERVDVPLNSRNIKYYEDLGYEIPRVKGRWGITTPRGTTIMVDVNDLPLYSNIIVDVKCDGCENMLHMQYGEYVHHNHNGKYYCVHCYNSLFNLGVNNSKYNPTITDEERIIGRKYQEYDVFIRKVLIRDNYTCQCCGHKNTDLEIHHLNGYNWYIEGRVDVKNGITLCQKCHYSFHSIYGRGNNTKEQFEEWYGKTVELNNDDILVLPSKRIYCFETDSIYRDAKDAAKTLNIKNHKNIYKVCNKSNKQHSTNGYHFLWYDDYITMNNDELKIHLKKCCENKNYRKIICLETLEIFDSSVYALKKYNSFNCSSVITQACKNINYTAFSYHWMYYDEYLEKNINNEFINLYASNKKKAVVCITTGELFKQVKDGADKYDVCPSGVSSACQGKQKHSGTLPDGTKLKWMFYDRFLELPIEEQNEILERNKDSSNDGSFINYKNNKESEENN